MLFHSESILIGCFLSFSSTLFARAFPAFFSVESVTAPSHFYFKILSFVCFICLKCRIFAPDTARFMHLNDEFRLFISVILLTKVSQ